ncbi:hypothetical protein P4S72_06780 [Vibrio sp. PP-XX7]
MPPRYQANQQPLRYRENTAHVEPCDKRFASYADFSITHGQQRLWIEVFLFIKHGFISKKKGIKCMQIFVVSPLSGMRYQKIGYDYLVFLWGTFDVRDAALLAEFDHEQCCTYALDTAARGSGQISRLCQIRKSGEPRLITRRILSRHKTRSLQHTEVFKTETD